MISENVVSRQQELRTGALRVLRQLSVDQKSKQSQNIRKHILDWLDELFTQAPQEAIKTLGVFSPLEDEPDLLPLYPEIQKKWPSLVMAFPKVRDATTLEFFSAAQFVASNWGVREPDLSASDTLKVFPEILLVPGVVFHPEGARIGRGKGYYDQYLSKNPHVVSCGICFQEQLVFESWDEQSHDRRMNYLISSESIFICSERG